jgi:serine acetyltransferase
LIGGIRVGDNVFIGVNAIVAQNIPDNSRVLCTSGIEVSASRPRVD